MDRESPFDAVHANQEQSRAYMARISAKIKELTGPEYREIAKMYIPRDLYDKDADEVLDREALAHYLLITAILDQGGSAHEIHTWLASQYAAGPSFRQFVHNPSDALALFEGIGSMTFQGRLAPQYYNSTSWCRFALSGAGQFLYSLRRQEKGLLAALSEFSSPRKADEGLTRQLGGFFQQKARSMFLRWIGNSAPQDFGLITHWVYTPETWIMPVDRNNGRVLIRLGLVDPRRDHTRKTLGNAVNITVRNLDVTQQLGQYDMSDVSLARFEYVTYRIGDLYCKHPAPKCSACPLAAICVGHTTGLAPFWTAANINS